jgi:hypothetical protein
MSVAWLSIMVEVLAQGEESIEFVKSSRVGSKSFIA